MNNFQESIKADLHRIAPDIQNLNKDFSWILGKNFPVINDLKLLVAQLERITNKLNESIEREKMRNENQSENNSTS